MARNLLGFKADVSWARQTAAALDTIEPLEAAAHTLAEAVRRILAGSTAGGKPYRAGREKRVAAAAGQAPARQRGELAGSITERLLPQRRLRTRRRIRVGTREREAPALEFGFKKGAGGIAEHPFMRPALAAARPAMSAAFRARLRARGLGRSAKQRALARRGREKAAMAARIASRSG